jgi:ABC-2 type transport system ATP-binding protein
LPRIAIILDDRRVGRRASTVRNVITIDGLTKAYGTKVAVNDLSVSIRPGRVTGFLGPNGSGKSTTMRCMLQLDRADRGEVSFQGKPFRSYATPLHEVGALLDAGYVHPGRSARNHLKALAASNGIAKSRVDEVLAMVGLAEVAGDAVKKFSLGMRQRLGLAGVMLGDPHTVILDEPANGLDPEGIRWIRDFLSYLAQQGRTVFVSSHLLSEMALMADHLVVIGQGRLMEEGSVADIVDRYADRWVRVRSPQIDRLLQLVAGRATARRIDGDVVDLRSIDAAAIGELAAANGLVLHELSPQTGSLEDAFLELTRSAQEYRAEAPSGPWTQGPDPRQPGPPPGAPLPPPSGVSS